MKYCRFSVLAMMLSAAALLSFTAGCSILDDEDKAESERIKQLIANDTQYEMKVDLRKEYMDIYYYWNEEVSDRNAQLKAYEYSDIYAWFDALLYSEDRWSWMEDAESYLESETGTSTGTWGASLAQATKYYNDYGVYVRYILPSSPLAKHGVTRGAQLRAVAGVEIGDSIDSQEKADAVNNHLYDTPNTFTFRLTDGTDVTFTESMTAVTTNYILDKRVFTDADFPGLTEPVGYFNYYSFNSNFIDDLDEAFAEFKAAGVRKMIVDLRYNGGGSTDASGRLISYLAPAGLAGKPYTTRTHNSLLSRYNYTETIGGDDGADISIGLTDLYFIMTSSSASASEMVYNGLRPYMGEKLHHVGQQTYGKPNGMYVLPYPDVEDYDKGDYSKLQYVYYPICFYNKNSEGEEIPSTAAVGSGFVPEQSVPDDIYHDFTPQEENIRACLYHIVNGSYPEVDNSHVHTATKAGDGFVCKSVLPEAETNPHYGKYTVNLREKN